MNNIYQDQNPYQEYVGDIPNVQTISPNFKVSQPVMGITQVDAPPSPFGNIQDMRRTTPSVQSAPNISVQSAPNILAHPAPNISAQPTPNISAQPTPNISAQPAPNISATPSASLLDMAIQKKMKDSAKSPHISSQPQPEQEPQPLVSGKQIISGDQSVSQKFGNPNGKLYGYDKNGRPKINRGTDFPIDENSPLSAPSDGKWVVDQVQFGAYNTGWGNSIVIRNAETNETLRYSHLKKANVKKGQEVTGKQLGLSGRTGNVTGPHLDLEYTNPQGKLSNVMASRWAKYL